MHASSIVPMTYRVVYTSEDGRVVVLCVGRAMRQGLAVSVLPQGHRGCHLGPIIKHYLRDHAGWCFGR